jgi:uncharacterized protein YgiM (DUF1202 family)
VRYAAALALSLAAASAHAATAYVSDELILGVYAEQNNQGQRLATLHSGTSLETLSVEGEFTQVRLADGTTGWVKSSFLTSKEPAVVRVKQLQDELDRSHATTPGLAEAAARNEVAQLQRALADKEVELQELRRTAPAKPSDSVTSDAFLPASWLPWLIGGGGILAAVLGFWLGYATLARRVRSKFGGIKVY